MNSPLLGPVVALVIWTLVMLIWMGLTRIPAMKRAGFDPPAGTRGSDIEQAVPGKANWAGHNYEHLLEQPTIFYAIVFALIWMGFDHPINVWLAWGYVGLRVVHSVIQATWNVVRVRSLVFMLSTLCLLSLAIHAALRLWH
jgi:hypothetical protein